MPAMSRPEGRGLRAAGAVALALAVACGPEPDDGDRCYYDGTPTCVPRAVYCEEGPLKDWCAANECPATFAPEEPLEGAYRCGAWDVERSYGRALYFDHATAELVSVEEDSYMERSCGLGHWWGPVVEACAPECSYLPSDESLPPCDA